MQNKQDPTIGCFVIIIIVAIVALVDSCKNHKEPVNDEYYRIQQNGGKYGSYQDTNGNRHLHQDYRRMRPQED